MTPGLRTHKQASLRVAMATVDVEPELLETLREIQSVQSGDRGKGHAAALLHQVTAEADRAWISLLITVKAFADGMTDDQLKRFYGKFGFMEIQAEPCLMFRAPVLPTFSRVSRIH